jgi:hypothetical protein
MLAATALAVLLSPLVGVRAEHEAVCSGVQVEVGAPKGRGSRRSTGYSAREVADLGFRVALPRRIPGRSLELWVYTPKGYLYQTLGVPLPAYASQGSNPRNRRVDLTFPVGGTLITMNGLYGRWRIEPHMDRAPWPCGRTTTFVVRP